MNLCVDATMDDQHQPETGFSVVDNALTLFWPVLIGINALPSMGTVSDAAVALGAILGAILTGIRIYEKLRNLSSDDE